MKNVQNFVTNLATIDYVEQSECYGHYPFQMFAETSDSKFELNALALGGDVRSCYLRFKMYFEQKAKRIYMSLDFPKGGDIKNDFVCIFCYEDGKLELLAIPYDVETGEKYNQIKESTQLDLIAKEFSKIVFKS